MLVSTVGLSWIVVKNLESAIKYYTEVVGLKVFEQSPEFGWAELIGHSGGTRLGIAQASPESEVPEGSNAVVTFIVKDIDEAKASMLEKGAIPEGEIQEVPGHVKLQMMVDEDGNRFQMCEILSMKSAPVS